MIHDYYCVLHEFDLLFGKPFDLIEEKGERFRLNINEKSGYKEEQRFYYYRSGASVSYRWFDFCDGFYSFTFDAAGAEKYPNASKI